MNRTHFFKKITKNENPIKKSQALPRFEGCFENPRGFSQNNKTQVTRRLNSVIAVDGLDWIFFRESLEGFSLVQSLQHLFYIFLYLNISLYYYPYYPFNKKIIIILNIYIRESFLDSIPLLSGKMVNG
jgi:hypothetical protein